MSRPRRYHHWVCVAYRPDTGNEHGGRIMANQRMMIYAVGAVIVIILLILFTR